MRFISESLLFVYTSTQDVRVLYTQNFMSGEYEQPSQKELEEQAPALTIFKDLDSRLRLLEASPELTPEQKDIEMERRKFLNNPVLQSPFGGIASQTISTFEDWIVFMTESGFYSVQHMTWQQYVETSE